MGRGIIEPVDDIRVSNPPVNEALLAALAEDFVKSGYDLQHVIRTIVNWRFRVGDRVCQRVMHNT